MEALDGLQAVAPGIIKAIAPGLTRDNGAPDDYEDGDGLKVCGVCHTRKQVFFEVEGLIPRTKVACMCKCEQDKQRSEDEARKREEARKRIEDMRGRGLADAQYRQCTFALDDSKESKASMFCRAYVSDWEWVQENNAGVMLYGDVGGGKTFLASCIANALIDQGVYVMMTSITRLTAAMQENYSENRARILREVASVPLLILDDVGAERNTPYALEQAYEIVNARYKAKRPLIVTTNLTMPALKNAENIDYKRIFDRLVEMCTPCKVDAIGRRQAEARSKHAAMLERFGL